MNLGEKQELTAVKKVEFGMYLAENPEDETRVLLPAKQVPEGLCIGDKVEIFLYRDSKDRLIATTHEPKLVLGQLAVLPVLEVGKIGAFLDWGLEKDLFLPYKEMTRKVNAGDEVEARIYEFSDNFGTFAAVDDKYSAMISKHEDSSHLRIGDVIAARVVNVKPDGKLDITLREKAYLQMDSDAQKVMEVIDSYAGVLPFTEKASPEVIMRETGLSKAAFKRAVGRLYKERKITLSEHAIRKNS